MSKIGALRDVLKVQGYNGNWNYDPYMLGLYNGLELALSIMEKRQPYFKDAPEVWLCDIPSDNISCEAVSTK
jgi:hypothetical protein